MIDYDSFSRCHLTVRIFFRFSRGSKRVNTGPATKELGTIASFNLNKPSLIKCG